MTSENFFIFSAHYDEKKKCIKMSIITQLLQKCITYPHESQKAMRNQPGPHLVVADNDDNLGHKNKERKKYAGQIASKLLHFSFTIIFVRVRARGNPVNYRQIYSDRWTVR